ncbi:hypothetical protein HPB50_002164 [Hyalomma asiaticum]|uniref:Uncharacterized protein n=1 Tax=Hyalomma asiaticum TaxID=266040 RepID=A0ACB7RRM4_HYAAI|nr:hypothetical protein HPB50_002164 [Hyalomma asiaticum]
MSRVPESERRDIVDLSLQSHSQRQVSAMKNWQLSTVNRIIQAYRTERRIKDAQRKARPQVTSEDEVMAIVSAAVDNPAASVEEVKKMTGLAHVSNTTVKRRLYPAGLTSRTAVQKPIEGGDKTAEGSSDARPVLTAVAKRRRLNEELLLLLDEDSDADSSTSSSLDSGSDNDNDLALYEVMFEQLFTPPEKRPKVESYVEKTVAAYSGQEVRCYILLKTRNK